MRLITTTCAIGFTLAAIAGCATPSREPVVVCTFPKQAAPAGNALIAQEYGAISPIPMDAVQFTSTVLSKQIAVQVLQAHRTETNTVQVTARLINCTDTPLVVAARVNFMDANQIPAEPQSVWQNLIMQPRSMGTYQESSQSKRVEHYVVELRDAGAYQR